MILEGPEEVYYGSIEIRNSSSLALTLVIEKKENHHTASEFLLLSKEWLGHRIQDSGFRIQDQDSGFRIQDPGFRIQDPGSRIQEK